MGAEVTLVIKADTTNAVKGINDVQKATQKLHDTATQGEKREKGILEEIDATLQRLQKARQKAFSYEDIEKYNKKIAETKQNLQEYEQAGLKVEKTTSSMTQSIGKWALSLGGAAAIIGVLKGALMKLTDVINVTKLAGAAWEQVLYNITTGQVNYVTGVWEAIKVQQKFNDLRMEGYKEGYVVQKLETEFQRKWTESLNQELTTKEKIAKIDEALAAKAELVAVKRDHAEKILIANLQKIQLQQGTEENVKAYWDAKREIEAIDAEMFTSTKRLNRQKSTLEKEVHDDKLKLWYDEIEQQNKVNEERLKQEQAYQQKAKELIDRYDKSNIDSLAGKEKLKAIRNLGIKETTLLKDELLKARKEIGFGDLTDEQYLMLQKMADNVWQAYYKALAEGANKGEIKISSKEKESISKALLGGMAELEGLQKTTITELQKRQIEVAGKQDKTIWSSIGIDVDTEEGQKAMEGLIQAKDTMIGVIDEIYQARVDDATRRRELLDTQVSETQEELEAEMELMKAGYANNVNLKRKELEELKKQREIALKKEEEAIKRQRQLDTITQISSLITAAAQTFKAFPGPLLPIGIAVIAAMFAAFAATKIRAAEATKLAEGGSGSETGIITGKSHHRGGERFLSHVEVEGGESWGVLSVPATQKFGNVFHHMVSSFNRGEIPTIARPGINNNVTVENSGPNSRLDQVVIEQRKLNARLSGDSVQDFGHMVVIRRGSVTKIIKR